MYLSRILSFDHHPAVVGLVDAGRGLLVTTILVFAYRVITGASHIGGITTWLFLLLSGSVICFVIGVSSTYILKEGNYRVPQHRFLYSIVGVIAASIFIYAMWSVLTGDWWLGKLTVIPILSIPSGMVLGDRVLSLRDPDGIAKLLRRGENIEAHLRLKDYNNRPHQ